MMLASPQNLVNRTPDVLGGSLPLDRGGDPFAPGSLGFLAGRPARVAQARLDLRLEVRPHRPPGGVPVPALDRLQHGAVLVVVALGGERLVVLVEGDDGGRDPEQRAVVGGAYQV